MQTPEPLVRQQLDTFTRPAWGLVKQVTDGELLLDASYQRGSVWTTEQRRDLVRSWLLGLPIPAIILNRRCHDRFAHPTGDRYDFAAVDGKQRILAAHAWFTGELDIPASWLDPELVVTTRPTTDGPYVTIEDLTASGRRYTQSRFQVPVAEASVDSVAAEAMIFGLVNGAGVPQTVEDLQRAARLAEPPIPEG